MLMHYPYLSWTQVHHGVMCSAQPSSLSGSHITTGKRSSTWPNGVQKTAWSWTAVRQRRSIWTTEVRGKDDMEEIQSPEKALFPQEALKGWALFCKHLQNCNWKHHLSQHDSLGWQLYETGQKGLSAVKTAEGILGSPLPNLDLMYADCVQKKASGIVAVSTHPDGKLFVLLPPGRRWRIIKTRITRLRDSFSPELLTLSPLSIDNSLLRHDMCMRVCLRHAQDSCTLQKYT